ncbi:MAG TPA: hypothetical protein VFS09_11140, partial [Candidatus Eisenbacteria bacterium]|nr:hypothetical protein [Candidatus Eisenbacteria bacterium]
LARFNLILAKYGRDRVLRDVRFKKAREMWLTAVFALGLSKADGKEYWIAPEHREQTPDTYVCCISRHPTRTDAQIQEKLSLEITEWVYSSPKSCQLNRKKRPE